MKNFKTWLRQWDEGNFDFTKEPEQKLPEENAPAWKPREFPEFENKEYSIFAKLYPVMSCVLAAVMIVFLMAAVIGLPEFGSGDTIPNTSNTIRRYVEKGIEETGAVNVVAGVILDYRAFDTLGESHVLFTATVAVFILLLSAKEKEEEEREKMILSADPVLRNTAKVLIPIIILFGFYVIFNGHLGPGGGFSGGAIIGAGLILYSMSFGPERLKKIINMTSYRIIVLIALMFYSCSKCYSFFCGANGYETIFKTGTPGNIFSAGLILPLNMAVGIVVACTMYGFYAIFMRERI